MILRFHAAARELAGVSEATITLDGQLTEVDLRIQITSAFPNLEPYLSRMRFACNDTFAVAGQKYIDADVVDVMPPVAGGAPSGRVVLCAIRNKPLSAEEVIAAVADPAAGATASFLGVVRNHHRGESIARLEYEAHPTLAEKEMRRVLEALCAESGDVRIAAVHRVGSLEVGETAVAIAVSAAHRGAAFDVCREAIDRIKETVPIWKKEWGTDGLSTWVNL